MEAGVLIAIITGAVSLLVAILPKIIDLKFGMRKTLNKLTDDVTHIKEVQGKQGDVIYQMLDHMVTNNNTGRMKACLDDYNSFNRHN